MYLLDTNVWSVLLKGRSRAVLDRFRSVSTPNLLSLSAVVWAELLYGWQADGQPVRLGRQLYQLLDRHPFVDFDASAADRYGVIRTAMERSGTPIGRNDYLIAATALANDLTLVTHNVQEFARIPGLRVEDWQTDAPG